MKAEAELLCVRARVCSPKHRSRLLIQLMALLAADALRLPKDKFLARKD
jgi:hypothetical protein